MSGENSVEHVHAWHELFRINVKDALNESPGPIFVIPAKAAIVSGIQRF